MNSIEVLAESLYGIAMLLDEEMDDYDYRMQDKRGDVGNETQN